MKIIHVIYSMELGGAEVLVAQLCRMQRAHGHDVSVFAYSMLGSVGEGLRDEGFEIYVPGEAPPALTMLRYYRQFVRLRPDVVHCHNLAATLQGALSARLAGVRCVISTRHSLVAPPYDVAGEVKYNLIARSCDVITGICEITCENLRGAPLAQKEKIVRVYNGASAVERVEPGAAGEEFVKRGLTLVFVGRLAAVKDLGTLVRAVAMASVTVPELQAWIVGDGPVKKDLEALAVELGVSDRVRFWGQRMDTDRFFSAADVFAMSSVSEGLPMSLLQAMSLGVPAVLTDVGGMAEVLGLSGGGVLTPVADPVRMAEAIVRVAGDSALRAELGRRAVETYRAEFTLERMDAAYMAIYRGESGLPDWAG